MVIRKVPMEELVEVSAPNLMDSVDTLHSQLLTVNKADRDLYEKSIKAFVSWVRSYHEHEASFIFNFKNVDLASAAKSFGLFRIPKMPETKSLKIEFENVVVNVRDLDHAD